MKFLPTCKKQAILYKHNIYNVNPTGMGFEDGRVKDLLQRVMIATVYGEEKICSELLGNLTGETDFMDAVGLNVSQYEQSLKKKYETYGEAIAAFDNARTFCFPYAALHSMGLVNEGSDEDTPIAIAREIRGRHKTRPGNQAPSDT